jgi:TRAP-type C4-dicarboxylate transport system permease small subunit
VLNRFEEIIHRLSNWFQFVGIAGMLLMMVITCVDVVGAKVFKAPILGAIDIVMLAQIIAISFANCVTLIAGRHIQVEFVFDLLPRPVQTFAKSIITLLSMGLFILIIWRLGDLGYSFQKTGEYSMTAYIPYYPFTYAVAFSSIPVCLVLFLEFLKTVIKGVRK